MHLQDILANAVVIFLAGIASVLLLARIGLPPVVGFLTAGFLIGPHALGLVEDVHTVEVLAEFGVALLLFTIGLEFSFDRLKRIGRLVAVGGTLQVALTVGGGVLVALLMGASAREGVFWGYVAALSSTAIVLRALADRGEVNAPHGRLVVGVLIFQDLCIVPMMLTLPLLGGQGGNVGDLLRTLGTAALVVVLVVAAARRLVPMLLARVAKARIREAFVLTVLLVAAGVAWATSSLGLSIALGAFLAGVVVADTEFVHQALSDVTPFRDALASLFFVSVGMLLDPRVVLAHPFEVGGLVLLLIGGKLVLAALAVLLMRFPARVAVLSGIALAQVGEFSFVLLRAGEGQGLIQPATSAALLAASVITMVAAPLLLAASPGLAAGARLLRPLERLFAVRPMAEEAEEETRLHDHVVVAGLGLGGRTLLAALESARVPYVAVELNPETVVAERAAGRNVRYGDISSLEVMEHVGHVAHARQVVLLLSDVAAARRAASVMRERFPNVPVLVRVHRWERDLPEVALPGVQVVAEDHEAAVEVVERVLRGSGVAGDLVAGAITAARAARGSDGAPALPPTQMASALGMEALTLRAADAAAGRTVAEVSLPGATGALVVAVSRAGTLLPSPRPSWRLEAGDTLFLVGLGEQLAAAREHLVNGAEVHERPAPAREEVRPPALEAPSVAPPAWLAHAVPVVAPLGITGVLAFLHATTGLFALVLYAAAIVLSGLVGGLMPACAAALFSFCLANVTFVDPVGELTLEPRIVPLLLLCALSVAVGMAARRFRALAP